MAKLITIHGTNAGDMADLGSKWWQLGSPFQVRISQQLDLEKGGIEIIPFHWDTGANSETKRRQAGLRLLEVLRRYDTAGVDYHILAHSHGGSVAYYALMGSAKNNRPLIRLKSWTTVGTPFIYFKKRRFLFSRFGPIGQAYFTISTILILLGMLILGAPKFIISPTSSGVSTSSLLFTSATLGSIGMLGYLALIGLDNVNPYRYSQKHRKLCAGWYQKVWRGVFHPEDEAISALRNVRHLQGRIFTNDFLVAVFALAPMILYLVIFPLILWRQGGFIIVFPDSGSSRPNYQIVIDLVLAFAIAYFILTAILVLVFRTVGYMIGIPLSAAVNISIWSQIKRTAWGQDLIGEYVQSIETFPNGFDCQSIAMPENVATAISAFTDQHSTETVRKARNILAIASQAGVSANIILEMSTALSWNELVHTAYFSNEEFIKFIALVLRDAGGAPLQQTN
jgi:hypothetical protein